MFRFSRQTIVILTLTFLVAVTLIFSDTSTASAHVASRHITVILLNSGPPDVDTNDKNAPPPSKDGIVYATVSPGKVSSKLVNDCGIVTCSLYFSRWQTTEIAIWGPAFVLAEGWIPGWVGFIITLGTAFIQARAQVASNFNACLRIRYLRGALAIVGVYVDQSGFCHDT